MSVDLSAFFPQPRLCRMGGARACALACALAVHGAAAAQFTACDADLDTSGLVDGADLTILLQQWGACGGCAADVTRDGSVSGADLTALLVSWGTACAPPWYEVIEQAPDPAVVTSAALRNAIVATGRPWRVRDIGTQIEMLLIPPGTFDMGCSASTEYPCGSDENPVHQVTLTNAFYMGRFEVTQAQWVAKMTTNPSYFKNPSADVPESEVPNRPVDRVSWTMISSTTGFLAGTGLRLPTEAEWEWACRAGTTTAFHGRPDGPDGSNEDSWADGIGWHQANSGSQTHPVGRKDGNGFGLHDMSGNVYEWVADWYSGSYYGSSPSTNPNGPTSGTLRSIRGGSWSITTSDLRSSFRNGNTPGGASGNYGFRVARNPS